MRAKHHFRIAGVVEDGRYRKRGFPHPMGAVVGSKGGETEQLSSVRARHHLPSTTLVIDRSTDILISSIMKDNHNIMCLTSFPRPQSASVPASAGDIARFRSKTQETRVIRLASTPRPFHTSTEQQTPSPLRKRKAPLVSYHQSSWPRVTRQRRLQEHYWNQE